MSSMRNAVQRRNHRERAQPEERARLGLLEKGKDYKLRAHDHKDKVRKLKALKQKVAERNPDEFSFGMLKKSITNNKNGTLAADRGNTSLSMDVVRLLKTQDIGYVRTTRNKTAKEVERLEEQVVGIRGHGTKVIYVDDKEGQMNKLDEMAIEEDSEGEGPKKPDLEARKLRKLQKRTLEKAELQLELAKERLKTLTQTEEALDLQRAKMNKTVGGVNKNGVKFKIRERKR